MTISKSLIEELKTNKIFPYQIINDVNLIKTNLSTAITNSFRSISENTNALKAIINMSTDQEVSSGPNKLTLSKLPIHSQKGLFISNGRIKRLPRLQEEVKPIHVLISGSGNSYITMDESGEELKTPKVFFAEDIRNGSEFQYQNDGMAILEINFSFNSEERVSIIRIDTGNSYSGSQTVVNSVYINTGSGIRFNTIKVENSIILILDEEISPTSLTINMSSSAYIKDGNISLLRFKSIKFGIVGYDELSSLTFGPIGSNNLNIIKAGISTDKTVKGIYFKISPDNITWFDFDTENDRGYSTSLNTIFNSSKNIKTNKIYIEVQVKNEKIEQELSNIVFERYAGDDCFDTTLMFGASTISNQAVHEYCQSVYSIQDEKFILPEDIDVTKNYRITSIPFNPIIVDKMFEDKYGAKIVVDPSASVVNVYGPVLDISNISSTDNIHFVYKKKADYIPGKYTYIINGIQKRSFDIYGDYDFSLSRYILKVKKEDVVLVKIENELGTSTVTADYLANYSLSDTENLINMAKLFIINNNAYKPGFFYPYQYDSSNSITENGENIQNGLYLCPMVKTKYPKAKTGELSIRDILEYSPLGRVSETEKIDRVKVYKSRHKKIYNISITSDSKIVRENFINGKSEFIEKKIFSIREIISSSSILIPGLSNSNKVEVYTSGYAKKLMRVYSQNDIVSIYNYYVDNNQIYFSSDMNNETVNITYGSTGNGKIIPNAYSVDQDNGVIYFSSYQNDIIIKYEFIDMAITTNMLTSKNISIEGVHEEIGISSIVKMISSFKIQDIPSINIGVIYE
jgi:hypothetical protein